MTLYRKFAYAGVSLLAMASVPAFAEEQAPAAGASSGNMGDIVVMARRREERLQDVPKVVNAVSSDDLRKNNIQKFEDVQGIVPGLNLQDSNNGLVQNASLRGASFDVDSGLQSPTIQFYLNDANIQVGYIFQSMYDIGQIEVLRGPQGTLRGRSAPSGAITLTTKLPNLYKLGGYGEFTEVGGPGGQKYEAALNAPIIAGKLAVRVAGTISDNEGSGVHPVNTALYPNGPFNRTWSGRVSVRAMPFDNLEVNLMYQRLVNRADSYVQTESTCLIDPSQPCGSGPLIKASDRLSTINGQRFVYQQMNIWNARVDFHVLGQKLSYVGQYALEHLLDEEPEDGANYFNTHSDATTTYPGNGINYAGTASPFQKTSIDRSQYQSHEVRLASEERMLGLFDYVIGFNTIDSRTDVQVSQGIQPHSQISYGAPLFNGPTEVSWFGNLTAHPTEKLEISGGARSIIDKYYFPAVQPTQRAHDTIWTASASYHFTPDLMGYVNAGSSFRTPGTNLGLAFTPFTYEVFPSGSYPTQYFQIKPEKSRSYEVGFKAQFLDRKLTLNLDYYHQDYDNYQYVGPDFIYAYISGHSFFPPFPAENFVGAPIVIGTANVPAKVDGIEGDFDYRFSKDADIGGTVSYTDGRIKGGALVPCNINGFSTLSASNLIASCPGTSMSINPRFSASVHADYARPLTDQVTGFVRGQVTVHGATAPGFNPYDHAPAYAVANLYAGVRSHDSAWELTLFVKNLFNDQTRLPTYGGNIQAVTPNQPPPPTAASQYGPAFPGNPVGSNYTYVSVVPPRQFGVKLRYAFGSR